MDYRDRKPHKCKRKYQNELIPRVDPYLRFVVHEHDAWKYHFDFRFELGGALRDFVVPKGPSTDPTIQRYSFSYHDHDLRCLKTEHSGDGRHGAIIIWDTGKIRPICSPGVCQEEAIWIGLEKGSLEFELLGEKLKGRWKLFRSGKDWVWQKIDDEFASSENILLQNRSVKSGRTLREMYWSFVTWLELLEFYIIQRETPQVIHRDDRVLDRNQPARARGVHPGLDLRKAKAILQEAEYLPWEAEAYYRKQAEWLDICTQFSNIIEPEDQHSAWVDLTAHPDWVATAEELVRTLARETGMVIRSGLAPTKWVSRLAAKYHDTGVSAHQDPKAFVANLHIRELLPVSAETRDRLSFLGYYKIGQVADLPFAVLQEQFDQSSYVIHAAANGGVYEPVQAAYPPESCLDRFVFDGLAESTEIIHNGLATLAERVGMRLEFQSLEGTKLTIKLEYEDSSTKIVKRTFSKPIRDSRSALVGMSLLLEKELSKPLISIQVLVSDLRKVRVAQGAFLDGANTRVTRRLEAAVQRARTVYGDQSVKLGQDIQLPRRVLVLREWKNATGWR